MKLSHLLIALVAMLAAGCAHEVTFEQPEHYVVSGRHQDEPVTAVIDAQTLKMKVPINSFMTGAAHTWEVEPGDMLKQVADIELPQMFSKYDFTNSLPALDAQGRHIVVEFRNLDYTFTEFHAAVAVRVRVTDQKGRELLEKVYSAQGITEGSKMFFGGAFAMKSAIRQSSLAAYKKIFEQLRSDLGNALARQSA